LRLAVIGRQSGKLLKGQLENQVACIHRGHNSPSDASVIIVQDYMQHQMLKGLGYSFCSKDLTDFDVQCYAIISNKFTKLKNADMKRKTKGK